MLKTDTKKALLLQGHCLICIYDFQFLGSGGVPSVCLSCMGGMPYPHTCRESIDVSDLSVFDIGLDQVFWVGLQRVRMT